ncbi:hypothetical protein DE146DRAFT_779262 [Phaeosphaeria sp. MPI-PUGE-AT-0046c]|nr:hypothetical protein DE146DRAFT_779262 [Phaeosphaeria sp. MPI-PUGE-AT-0046c]
MLWCKFLPFAASLWGCRQKATVPLNDSAVEKLFMDSRFVELLIPPTITIPPVTVTATVGIPASAIVHAHAPAGTSQPTAPPRASLSHIDYDYRPYSDSKILDIVLSFLDDRFDDVAEWWNSNVINHPLPFRERIYAICTDGITIPAFRITPFHLIVATYIIGWLHLLCMILFGDYRLPAKAVVHVLSGLGTSSMMFWTMQITAMMYLICYDKLREDPITLAISEILHWNTEHADFVSHFISGKVLSWKHFCYYSPMPRDADCWWLLEDLGIDGPPKPTGLFWPLVEQFKHYHWLQENGKFTPKTFTDIFIGVSVGLYRFGVGILDRRRRMLSAIWRVIGPSVTRQAHALPRRLKLLFGFIGAQLRNSNLDWYLLVRGVFKTSPLAVWNLIASIYAYLRVWHWSRIEARCGKPFRTMPGEDIPCKLRDALLKLGTMSMVDMANVLIELEEAKNDVLLQEPRTRQRVEKEHTATMKELAGRALSWRASHRELVSDYNHCRSTLDNVMRYLLCGVMDTDPDAPEVQSMFRSGGISLSDEPLSNGLHYKEPSGTSSFMGVMTAALRDKYTSSLKACMENCWKNIRGSKYRRFRFPSGIDLYKESTWPFDMKMLGLRFANFPRDASPFNLDQRRPRPYVRKELEDYVAAGHLQEWFEDMPARLELKRPGGSLKPFFDQQKNKLKYKSDSRTGIFVA